MISSWKLNNWSEEARGEKKWRDLTEKEYQMPTEQQVSFTEIRNCWGAGLSASKRLRTKTSWTGLHRTPLLEPTYWVSCHKKKTESTLKNKIYYAVSLTVRFVCLSLGLSVSWRISDQKTWTAQQHSSHFGEELSSTVLWTVSVFLRSKTRKPFTKYCDKILRTELKRTPKPPYYNRIETGERSLARTFKIG